MRDTGSHNGFPVLAVAQTTLRLGDKGTDFVSALYTGLQRICLGLERRSHPSSAPHWLKGAHVLVAT